MINRDTSKYTVTTCEKKDLKPRTVKVYQQSS